MHAPAVAEQLRGAGHDVVAVKERPELVGLPDAELLAAATADDRVVVTENVKDVAALARRATSRGERHAGLVFTHPQRFRRGARGHVRALATALGAFLVDDAPSLEGIESFTWWLAAPGEPPGS
jgi:hypothetical protein